MYREERTEFFLNFAFKTEVETDSVKRLKPPLT